VRTIEARRDLETIFGAQYERIARVIARIVRDPARAEELAVEVFLKLWRNPQAQEGNTEGWLYRAAVRTGLDELRRQTRQIRYERLLGFVRRVPTPRQAELLLLRSHGLTYDEVASALHLNPASVRTLLSRAQHAFRKEYIKRYGRE
jgi:RNA polymerase sigma-70 factor (ECF subfamily)